MVFVIGARRRRRRQRVLLLIDKRLDRRCGRLVAAYAARVQLLRNRAAIQSGLYEFVDLFLGLLFHLLDELVGLFGQLSFRSKRIVFFTIIKKEETKLIDEQNQKERRKRENVKKMSHLDSKKRKYEEIRQINFVLEVNDFYVHPFMLVVVIVVASLVFSLLPLRSKIEVFLSLFLNNSKLFFFVTSSFKEQKNEMRTLLL